MAMTLISIAITGQKLNISNIYKSDNGFFDLVDIEIIPQKLTALPDKIYGRPYPGLNMDNLPLFLPILTQTNGQTLVHDWTLVLIYWRQENKKIT